MPDPSDVLEPLSAVDAARELTRVGAAFAGAFDSLAAAAADPATPRARRVVLAEASRLVGGHAVALAALAPESVLLADARAAGATPWPVPADPEACLATLAARLDELTARATPVADAALLRVARGVLAELGDSTARLAAAG